MENESRDVSIPIRAIVEESMNKNGAKYMEDEFNLLRKYFIACLNLRYMFPKDLTLMVDKFSKKIKFIVLNYNSINNLDYYKIVDSVLYINGSLKYTSDKLYEITFYKAVSEVIFKESNKYISFNNAVCQIVAEKIYNMAENNISVIMPTLKKDIISNTTHYLRVGYGNYELIITLLKQFLLYKNQNEMILIRRFYFEGYENVINELFNDNNSKLLLEVLDKIFKLDINYRIRKEYVNGENELIEKYQLIISGLFNSKSPSYMAFCSLLTTDKLKSICIKKQEE